MKTVSILMSSYNGEKYIKERIKCLLQQQDVIVKIIVRDDGSTDQTKSILEEYKSYGMLNWYTGDNLGPQKSFMDLVYNARNWGLTMLFVTRMITSRTIN